MRGICGFMVSWIVLFKRFFTGRCGRCGASLRCVRKWNCAETFNGASVSEVTELIKSGANVNARDKEGKTPIMFAARFCKDSIIIKILIDNGADITANSKAGMSVCCYAMLNDCLSVRNYVIFRFNGTDDDRLVDVDEGRA